jgi:hypothetical protein
MSKLGKIGWLALLAAAVILIYLLLVKPVVGLADNGDFSRIMYTVGITDLNQTEAYDDKHFSYFHREYGFSQLGVGGYISTEIIIVLIAVFINKIVHPHAFDIRFLAVIYAIVFLAAFSILLRLKLLSSTAAKLSFAVVFLIVFVDVGYSAYYNSLFGEPIAFVFLLLTLALALRMAEQDKPSKRLMAGFIIAAIFLIGSKVQYAPVGLILAILTLRFMYGSGERSWKKAVIGLTALLVLFSAVIYVTAPKELRVINQYQSVFYGILKDSPSPEKDLEELGIDPKLAVLAGTNYFTPNTPIPQSSEILKQEFYSKISHEKIALFYLKHPGRYWDKLQVTAENAMTIRVYYLGNYEKAEGFSRGKVSTAYDNWSKFKQDVLPHSLWFLLAFFALYYSVIILSYLNESSRSRRTAYEIMMVIGMIAVIAFVIPLLGDGEADMQKHLFLFNVCFDLMFTSAVVWIVHKFVKGAKKRVA